MTDLSQLIDKTALLPEGQVERRVQIITDALLHLPVRGAALHLAARQVELALRSIPPDDGWRTIDSAPDLDRVIVAGWSKPTKRVAGYWWFYEDVIINGKPDEHHDASLWHPFPALPPPPEAV